jgi:hypothetical protein
MESFGKPDILNTGQGSLTEGRNPLIELELLFKELGPPLSDALDLSNWQDRSIWKKRGEVVSNFFREELWPNLHVANLHYTSAHRTSDQNAVQNIPISLKITATYRGKWVPIVTEVP